MNAKIKNTLNLFNIVIVVFAIVAFVLVAFLLLRHLYVSSQYPDWFQDVLSDAKSLKVMNSVPTVLEPIKKTPISSSDQRLKVATFSINGMPECEVTSQVNERNKHCLSMIFDEFAICIVEPINFRKRFEELNNKNEGLNIRIEDFTYSWSKEGLYTTLSEFKGFMGINKGVSERTWKLLNAKRFQSILAQEVLLFEGEGLNAIIYYISPGKARAKVFRYFKHAGKFANSSFFFKANLYSKDDKMLHEVAFYFDPSYTEEKAKKKVQEFLSSVEITSERFITSGMSWENILKEDLEKNLEFETIIINQ